MPGGVGNEVDQVIGSHGRSCNGAFAMFFQVLEDQRLSERGIRVARRKGKQ
jgi:hypothetical protein